MKRPRKCVDKQIIISVGKGGEIHPSFQNPPASHCLHAHSHPNCWYSNQPEPSSTPRSDSPLSSPPMIRSSRNNDQLPPSRTAEPGCRSSLRVYLAGWARCVGDESSRLGSSIPADAWDGGGGKAHWTMQTHLNPTPTQIQRFREGQNTCPYRRSSLFRCHHVCILHCDYPYTNKPHHRIDWQQHAKSDKRRQCCRRFRGG